MPISKGISSRGIGILSDRMLIACDAGARSVPYEVEVSYASCGGLDISRMVKEYFSYFFSWSFPKPYSHKQFQNSRYQIPSSFRCEL